MEKKAKTKTGRFTKGQKVWCWWRNTYLYFDHEGYANEYDPDNRCLVKKRYYQFYDIADVSVRIYEDKVDALNELR